MEEKKRAYMGPVDLLLLLGVALICAGIGLAWGVPAALICAGVFCLAGGVLIDFSGEEGGDGGT